MTHFTPEPSYFESSPSAIPHIYNTVFFSPLSLSSHIPYSGGMGKYLSVCIKFREPRRCSIRISRAIFFRESAARSSLLRRGNFWALPPSLRRRRRRLLIPFLIIDIQMNFLHAGNPLSLSSLDLRKKEYPRISCLPLVPVCTTSIALGTVARLKNF